MWDNIRLGLASALMALALLTLCTGVLGVFRFRDTLQRMHAAAVNDTLGVFLALLSLILAGGFRFVSLKIGLVLIFLWISSPITSHLIAQLEFRSRGKDTPPVSPRGGKAENPNPAANTRRGQEVLSNSLRGGKAESRVTAASADRRKEAAH